MCATHSRRSSRNNDAAYVRTYNPARLQQLVSPMRALTHLQNEDSRPRKSPPPHRKPPITTATGNSPFIRSVSDQPPTGNSRTREGAYSWETRHHRSPEIMISFLIRFLSQSLLCACAAGGGDDVGGERELDKLLDLAIMVSPLVPPGYLHRSRRRKVQRTAVVLILFLFHARKSWLRADPPVDPPERLPRWLSCSLRTRLEVLVKVFLLRFLCLHPIEPRIPSCH